MPTNQNISIEKLTPRHYKILDFCVAGLTRKDIAAKLGMSAPQVGIVISSPSFQHQFALRRKEIEDTLTEHAATEIDEVKAVLQRNARTAADRLISGMDSGDEKIILKSAVEILDRTGYPKEQKVTSDGNTGPQIFINTGDMNLLKESLQLDSEITTPSTELQETKTKDEVGVPTGSGV